MGVLARAAVDRIPRNTRAPRGLRAVHSNLFQHSGLTEVSDLCASRRSRSCKAQCHIAVCLSSASWPRQTGSSKGPLRDCARQSELDKSMQLTGRQWPSCATECRKCGSLDRSERQLARGAIDRRTDVSKASASSQRRPKPLGYQRVQTCAARPHQNVRPNSGLGWRVKVDKAVGELLVRDIADCDDKRADACRTARESR